MKAGSWVHVAGALEADCCAAVGWPLPAPLPWNCTQLEARAGEVLTRLSRHPQLLLPRLS